MFTFRVLTRFALAATLLLSATLSFAEQAKPVTVDKNLTRGPYLQMATDSSMMIRWRSAKKYAGQVRYGLAPDKLDKKIQQVNRTTEHAVTLTGLKPNTRYHYAIANGAKVLKKSYFETAPKKGDRGKLRLWVIGDSGTANQDAKAVYDAYMKLTGDKYTDTWLMLGDNAYKDGTDAEFQKAVFDMYPELLSQSPVWSTLGNHDGYSADSASESGPYFDMHSFPRRGEAGGVPSGTEAYYSFDYGNVHFVVLDSYLSDRSPQGAMMAWLKADLEAFDNDWLVAFWHHPPYSKGSHDTDKLKGERPSYEMRGTFLPVLESYGVDLVLTGHSHGYERSYHLHGHYDVSSTLKAEHIVNKGDGARDGDGAYTKAKQTSPGTVYVVNGASGKVKKHSGKKDGPGSYSHPAMIRSMPVLGSMILEIEGDKLDATYLGTDGKTLDGFSIDK